MSAELRIGLYYDDSAYVETLQRSARPVAEAPAGLVGRQVAGREFLDAWLAHGDWSELVALVPNRASARSIIRTCRTHASSRERQRRLRLFYLAEFHDQFLAEPPAPQLYFPCPPDPQHAWARQHAAPHSFALSGVTHTLCSARAIEVLRSLVTAPFEPYDRLICTSRAVTDMVRAVTGSYADYLKERFGGSPAPRIGFETIPLGVNTDKFRPPSPDERSVERARLEIADDEVALLFVGRLSHHAKAHPFPLFRGAAAAARQTGAKLHLLFVGWAANESVLRAFQSAASEFAPGVRVSFLDGLQPENRFGAWRAADVFISLSDNIQETFGLVIVEAMASGLPVVATDWNGYRDLVLHSETGFLIPTALVSGATTDLTSRLLLGEINYDHFLARSSQCVSVDCAATAQAISALACDADLRRRMGNAGRRRAVAEFSWEHVVRSYESLWKSQEAERRQSAARSDAAAGGLPAYPPLEQSFAGYPSTWLDLKTLVAPTPDAPQRLERLLKTPLTNHAAESRCHDAALLQSVLRIATDGGASLQELLEPLGSAGVPPQPARATLAWMMKYDLLRTSAP